MALDDSLFCDELTRASEYCLGKVTSVSRRYKFPLRQNHAVDYVLPRVALVGDAAHTIHPLAGQGVNLGFADVAALADEVIRARGRNIDVGDESILKRYQRRRKPENLATMGVMEGPRTLLNLPEGCPGCVIPRWLRGQPGQSARHPTPFLAFLTPET